MNIREEVQRLADAVPTIEPGDSASILRRARIRTLRRRAIVGLGGAMAALSFGVVLGPLLGSEQVRTPIVGSSPDGAVDDCDAIAAEAADLVVDLADHAGGKHPGQLPAPSQGGFGALAASVAEGDETLEGRIDDWLMARQASDCRPGFARGEVAQRVHAEISAREQYVESRPEQYTAVNAMALLADSFPAEGAGKNARGASLPDGFPEEFPIHPGAELAFDEVGETGATAVWNVSASESYRSVLAFYRHELQQGGEGWSIPAAEGTELEPALDAGNERFNVRGYGYAGVVKLEKEADGSTSVQATLERGNR